MHAPKGKLIAIGGNEDKGTDPEPNTEHGSNINFFGLQILSRILHEAGGKESCIEIITTASSIPEEVGENYQSAFEKLGATNIGVMHIKQRDDTSDKNYLERIRKCNAILFTGGNQLRLTSIFGGTNFLTVLHERYANENFLISGTSAGAMAMSNTMIYQGSSSGALFKGEVKTTTGLSFIKEIIIDSHFDKRGRFGRLAQAIACNPSCTGMGLGEDTGILIIGGNHLEAIGSGLVIILDGHDIHHSNIADLPDGSPISIENLIVHVMVKGNGYILSERKFLSEVRQPVN